MKKPKCDACGKHFEEQEFINYTTYTQTPTKEINRRICNNCGEKKC